MPSETLLARQAAGVVGRLLLNEREAAAAMGCSTRTLFSLRAAGQLAWVPIGNKVMYAPGDLAAFIESKKTRKGSADAAK